MQFSRPMNDNAHTIVVGMMQTSPFTHMFDLLRRVYSAQRLMSCLSCANRRQSRDKGIGGAVNHVRYTKIIQSIFAPAYEERGDILVLCDRIYLSYVIGYTYPMR